MYGDGGRILITINCMYETIMVCVRRGRGLEGKWKVDVAQRQRSVMSPWLLNIFSNGVVNSKVMGRGLSLVGGQVRE